MGACITPQGCLADVLDGFWGGLADAAVEAAGQMVTQLFTWWTATGSASVDTAVLRTAQSYVLTWIGIPVAVMALLATVSWGVAGASHTWVRDVARGLLVFGVSAVGSIPIVRALQEWSESLTTGLLAAVPTRDVGARFTTLLSLSDTAPALVAFWGSLVLMVGAVQYLLMLFRDGAVLVLTVMVPVAAAGQFSRGSVLWLPKITGWLLAFVFVKPAAALIYYLGLSLIGEGRGVQALVTGLCVMVAAVFALPALLRLVTFAVNAAPMNSNALGAAATVTGMTATGAQLAASRRLSAGAAAPQGAAPAMAAAPAAAAGAVNAVRGAARAVDPWAGA